MRKHGSDRSCFARSLVLAAYSVASATALGLASAGHASMNAIGAILPPDRASSVALYTLPPVPAVQRTVGTNSVTSL